jgi:hypothetical protein
MKIIIREERSSIQEAEVDHPNQTVTTRIEESFQDRDL